MDPHKITLPLTDIGNILPILQKISLFGGLNDKQLYTMFRHLQEASFEAGELIFQEGENPDHLFIVEKGQVKIVSNIDNDPYEIIVFGVGQCFGETSVIGIMPHTASAVSLTNTTLIVLSRKALFEIYEADKELFSMLILNIAREACRRLARTDQVLLHYARHHH